VLAKGRKMITDIEYKLDQSELRRKIVAMFLAIGRGGTDCADAILRDDDAAFQKAMVELGGNLTAAQLYLQTVKPTVDA
jgi:hypothetical protein